MAASRTTSGGGVGRRSALGLTLAGLARPRLAAAQAWPARPVRIIVPFPPGGPGDIISRAMAERLQPVWGQPIVVENRPGGAGTIGSALAARAPADGYTLLMATNAHVTTPKLIPRLPFDPLNDFTPIMRVASYGMFCVVHPSVAETMPDFIAKARAAPGRMTAANLGVGSVPHLAAAQLALAAGVEFTHVPYSGGPTASLGVLNGEVNMLFFGSLVMEHVRLGRLRALGVGSIAPSPDAPEVPIIASFYPGYEATAWFGIMGPAGMPEPLVAKIYADCRQAVDSEDLRRRVRASGIHMEDIGPAAFHGIVAADLERWADVITRASIQPG
jgi:tripartite-type tricarboxylate transporter receptor subunit TctC